MKKKNNQRVKTHAELKWVCVQEMGIIAIGICLVHQLTEINSYIFRAHLILRVFAKRADVRCIIQ